MRVVVRRTGESDACGQRLEIPYDIYSIGARTRDVTRRPLLRRSVTRREGPRERRLAGLRRRAARVRVGHREHHLDPAVGQPHWDGLRHRDGDLLPRLGVDHEDVPRQEAGRRLLVRGGARRPVLARRRSLRHRNRLLLDRGCLLRRAVNDLRLSRLLLDRRSLRRRSRLLLWSRSLLNRCGLRPLRHRGRLLGVDGRDRALLWRRRLGVDDRLPTWRRAICDVAGRRRVDGLLPLHG
jgi:hypothetical protein